MMLSQSCTRRLAANGTSAAYQRPVPRSFAPAQRRVVLTRFQDERDHKDIPGTHTPFAPPVAEAVKEDHDGIKGLFNQFFDEGRDIKERQRLAWQIIRDLTIHSLAEEETVYPILKNKVGSKARDHALEGHTQLKKMLVKLDGMHLEHSDGSINREYVDLFKQVLQPLEEHIAEEEGEWLPQLKSALSEQEQIDLARAFEASKDHVPTRPHVLPPNKPVTGNVVGNIATGPIDKLRDNFDRWGNGPIPSVVKRKHQN